MSAIILVPALLFVGASGVFGAAVSVTNTYRFTYGNRDALLADGWSFLASTPVSFQVGKFSRDTETTSGAVVSYDQGAHSGVLRIPVDTGDIWQTQHDSRNTLFRPLPSNWISARLTFTFQPTKDFQQASLLVYEDDDNYVGVAHAYNASEKAAMVSEVSGVAAVVGFTNLTTTNLILRLDRDLNTDNVTGLCSLDGTNWKTLGQVWQTLSNPQLAIFTGFTGVPPSGFPNADLQQVDIIASGALPAPVLMPQPQHLVFNSVAGQPCTNLQQLRVIVRSVDSAVQWTLTNTAAWVSVNSLTGTTPGFCDVSVNTSGLAPGLYQGLLQLSAPGAISTNALVTLIVNPASRARIAAWHGGKLGAMSVSVDDSNPTAFDDLSTNGFGGTYMLWGLTPIPPFATNLFYAGMELAAHTVNHPCYAANEAELRWELESNIASIVAWTPATQTQVLSFAWPCGNSGNAQSEAVVADYFLSARGYNINQLEDSTPYDLMNLKTFNSHEHSPYPPADLKTMVDAAITNGKWFNMVLHATNNDNGAISYAVGKDIWMAPIGSVVKYLLQRDRTVITNYIEGPDRISFDCYRLLLDPSSKRNFETAVGPQDTLTLQVEVTGIPAIYGLTVNGLATSYTTRVRGAKTLLLFDTPVTGSAQTMALRLTTNSTLVLPLSGFSRPGGVPTFDIPNTVSSSQYTLVYKANLTDSAWTPLAGSGTGAGNGGTLRLSDPTVVGSLPAHRFYRLQRNP